MTISPLQKSCFKVKSYCSLVCSEAMQSNNKKTQNKDRDLGYFERAVISNGYFERALISKTTKNV